jgi:apolipoprotein N-acyltransferase
VAVPAETGQVAGYLAGIDRIMEARDASLLLGIMDYDEDLGGYSNSVLLLGPGEGIYRKRHLVPFGEYFPVPDFIREWMRLMSLPYTDTAAGPERPELLQAAGEKVALTICYEDAFGAEQLYALPEATLLVNVSNDAWFGDSIAPHQHLQIARLRSLEAGRWQLRATNTGVTAFIDPRGRIHSRSPQFETAVLRARVEPRTGLTPYAATGNWPVVGLCLALLAAGTLAARRRR